MSTATDTKPSQPEEWLQVLDQECKRTSQQQVADRLGKGISATLINQALKGIYPSQKGLDRLQEKVEGAYMGKTINCPVLDEITRDICIEKQEQPFAATNAQRVKLFRTCKTCPIPKKRAQDRRA